MQIKAARSKEVTYAVETHGRSKCAMLTLTIRHGYSDSLKETREALANAWRHTMMGAAYQRFRQRLGIWGTIRALEVTHGQDNGWHPHLHIILMLDSEISDSEIIDVTNDDGEVRKRWVPRGKTRLDWLIDRWRKKVSEHMPSAEPDDQHGVELSPLIDSDYPAKLGLEMSDPGIKRGRHHSRTPLEIAHHFVEHGCRKRDAALWQDYCASMKGAKFLTWSRGTKRALGIADRSDSEIAEQEEEPTETILIGKVDAYSWAMMRDREVVTAATTNYDGTCCDVGLVEAPYWVIEQAERGGTEGLAWALLKVAAGEVGRQRPRRAEP